MSEATIAAAPAEVPAGAPPAAVAPVVEAKPPPVAVPPVVIPAEVVARERAIRAQQQALAKEREALQTQRAEYDAWKASQAKAAADSADPLDQLKATRESVQQLQQRLDSQAAAAKANEDQRLLSTWREKQIATVTAQADKYELTLLGGYASAVPARIESHYSKTGEMLTADQAAEMIEKEIEAALDKATSSKKWKAKTAVQPPAPPAAALAADAEPGRVAPKPPATITNALTGTTQAASKKPETREQRIARLIATPWSKSTAK